MSIADQMKLKQLEERVAALENTVNLLCAKYGEICIARDPEHPAREILTLPEKRKSA